MKKIKVIAFREITMTKLIMLIITLIFVAFAAKQFFSGALLPEFPDIVKLFIGSWAVYAGKSGYEYYSRRGNSYNNYGNNNYGGGMQI